MTDYRLIADPMPYDYHELWSGDLPSEPVEIMLARALETAKRQALRVPEWETKKEPFATAEHVIQPLYRWGAGGEYIMRTFPPIEAEAYCMRIACNWGVAMRGDDCEARLKRAVEEHTGEPWPA